MEKIIYNKNNLSEKDVTDYVQKVKLLIFNKENQMLLVYAHNDFEFPGGTVEPNENLIDTINREIEEELGIKLNLVSLESFAQSIGYYKDWPEKGRNKKIEINYYELMLEEKPHEENLHLTDNEKAGNFCHKYINVKDVKSEIKKNAEKFGDTRGIAKEMLNILAISKKINEKI